MVGKTNALGDPQSFDSLRFTYTIGSDVFSIQNGKTYKNGTETSSGLPFSIATGGTNKRLWEIKFTKSGTAKFLVFPTKAIDVFCCGGGGGGFSSGCGGGGGYTKTQKNIAVNLNQNYSVVIGAGGSPKTMDFSKAGVVQAAGTGGSSSAFGVSAAGGYGAKNDGDTSYFGGHYCGGNGGSGGGSGAAGGTNGGNGSKADTAARIAGRGQGTTTKAFGDSNATAYGAGGSGTTSSAPTANTGHGGNSSSGGSPTAGATGLVIIRNKR